MKVLIIGGVAGGATAAARLRRLDEQAEIIILERSGFVSYANCGLPYYIGGTIDDKEALSLGSPESFWSRFRIEVRLKNEVLSIDPEQKTVLVRRELDGSEYTESYDKLLLAPGARAIKPPLPGIENERVMSLRTVEDSYRIRDYITKNKPKRAVVIGGGFIGLEVAENLMESGVKVSLLQLDNQVLRPLDYDMACQVHTYLREQGLDLRLGEQVEGFEETNGNLQVKMAGGKTLETELVILAVGVVPDTDLAKKAGLTLGVKGAIVVNEYMETSKPDIYAVGDAAQISHGVSGEQTLISLAGPANKQGRIAANHICGRPQAFKGAIGSSVIKLFDMTVANTGLNEGEAQRAGIKYDKAVNYSANHATYYPGASFMTIKTLFDPDSGRILGAQAVGFDGVDKRMDVLATAVRMGLTSEDLEELDLVYAPPYGSAKDPVNMVGYTIENLRQGLVSQHHWHDLEALPRDGSVILLDVRTQEEIMEGGIPGTIHIPVDELRDRLGELDKGKRIYVNCQSGLRSYIACRILMAHGFTCSHLSGGYAFYRHMV